MWEDHKKLRHISESISGCNLDVDFRPVLYYIRDNPLVEPEASLEYSLEKPLPEDVPDEIYQTSAGRIEMEDYGEFGGGLSIGGKHLLYGNFSTIFEYNGEKYVIDSLAHLSTYRFGLFRVNDDGTVEKLYSTADDPTDLFGYHGGASMDAYYIGEDVTGTEAVFFLCSGIVIDADGEVNSPARSHRERFLLIFNTHREKEHQIIRIDLPVDKVEFYRVTSIWSDGMMLSIGCENQVVMVFLPNMDTEYWTGIDEKTVSRLLEKKHSLK